MDSNENQPGGTSGRTITIHLTRDTLILIAALVFLTLAILLAVFFSPNTTGNRTPTSTPLAQIATTEAPSVQTTTAVRPVVANPTSITLAMSSVALQLTPTGEGYPAPEATPLIVPTTPDALGFSPAQISPLPTFAPNRPTIYAAPSATAPGSASFFSQGTAYPITGSSTTQPTNGAQPTDDLIVPTDNSLDENQPTAMSSPTTPPEQAEITPSPDQGIVLQQPTPLPGPTDTPAPTAMPLDVLRGTIHWTVAKSPILLTRDQQLVAGAVLLIEPGVEVRLAPGVSFFIEGTLYALGKPGSPVRFVGTERQRWEGLFGQPDSNILMEYTEIRGGGGGGTVLTSEGGNLTLRFVRINDNGGHVQVIDSRLEVRDSEISGNDMPYGAALDVTYNGGNFVTLTNNRVGGNRMSFGAPPVFIDSQSPFDTLNLEIRGNLLIGQQGPDLSFSTNGLLRGDITCNTFVNGLNGLGIRSETLQIPDFPLNVYDNAIEDHIPPIIPIYLERGIGRGATSEVALDMRNNWWDSELGPYDPEYNVDGRGDSVGDNIHFIPWLKARPACAPLP